MSLKVLFLVLLFSILAPLTQAADSTIVKRTPDGITPYDNNWSYADFQIPFGDTVISIYGGFTRNGYPASEDDYLAQYNTNSTAFDSLGQNDLWNYDDTTVSMYNRAINVKGDLIIGPGTLRVSIPTGVGAVWDSAGIVIATGIPAPPAAPVLSTPPNASINVPVSQNLTWNISTGATSYKVEIASDSLFSNIILNDSGLTTTTQTTGTLLNNTSYFWRVSAKDAGGSSPFSTVWKFTTILSIPAAPTLVSPTQSASNVALSTSLSWNAVTGVSSYRVQLATDSLFSNIILNDSGLTTTSQVIGPLTNSTTYYWRVNAKNSGGTSAYSTILKFTTIPATPGVPVLTSPPNGSVNISTTTSLNWMALSNAVSYVLELSSDSNFQSYLVFDSNLTSTSQVVGPLPNSGVFYWRVKGVNSNNVNSSWSLTWRYSTVPNPPTAPLQLSPAQNASLFDSTTFTWLGYVNSTSYDLQIATDSLFTQVFRDTTQTTTSVKIKNLLNGFTLYWRVNATGPGGISLWSNTGTFVTLTSAGIFNRPVQKSILKNGVFGGQVILDNRMINGVKAGF